MISEITQDCRYALRQLGKAPGFALTVVLTLALSVGVATAVFCVIDAVILRPLPYTHQERIVAIQSNNRAGGYQQPASWPSYQDERAQAKAFSALAAYWDYDKLTLESPAGDSVSLPSVGGTDNFFDVFGVRPLLGRTFLPGEQELGKNDIAVLSYETWQKHFNGDPAIVNHTAHINGRPFVVVGVMPPGFRFPLNMRDAIYTPLHIDQPWMSNRGAHWLRTVGRLRDGVSLDEAQADLTHVFLNMGKAYPATDEGRSVHLTPLAQSVNSKSSGPLWTLLGAVLALLAIGCVNVAGLLLARGVKREREMAMRVAIGAGRWRLLRQLLTEGLLMAFAGAVGGVVLTELILSLMRTFLVHALDRGADIHLDWSVLCAALATSAIISVAASLYPALRLSGIDPNRALKASGAASASRGQHRLRSSFVVIQMALTLVLLVVAGLLLRSVSRYRHTDLGFPPDKILAEQLQISRVKYHDGDVLASFYGPLEERVRKLPGVEAAGLINVLPIEAWGSNSDTHIAGQPPYPKDQEMLAETRMVSAGYFDVMGVALHNGRRLTASIDRPENKATTIVVNDAFVKKFIPAGLDPSLQRIDDSSKEEEWTTIVGVMGNVRQDIYEAPLAERDVLMNEVNVKDRADNLSNMTLLVRTKGDPKQIVAPLRAIIHNLDPSVPFETPRTMTEVVSETLVLERMESWLFGIFAGLAFALAMVGLYGLITQEVEQGTRDIGVRMALGATRARVLGMVMARVAWMLGIGAAAGLGLALMMRELIGMVIYFKAEQEGGSFALLALLLVACGLCAAVIPALRAASVEPMHALRSE
jgi:predicted permease